MVAAVPAQSRKLGPHLPVIYPPQRAVESLPLLTAHSHYPLSTIHFLVSCVICTTWRQHLSRSQQLPHTSLRHGVYPLRPLCSGLSDLCVALFPVFERSTPLLPITSLQPQQFHAITHSFAQRHAAIPPIFNGFRTLSIATGVYPSSFPTFRRLDLQTCQLFYFQRLAASWPFFCELPSFVFNRLEPLFQKHPGGGWVPLPQS